MPIFNRETNDGPVEIYYEIYGNGFPILLIAPGGMRSSIGFWENSPIDPINQWQNDYQIIAMDQRNAGRSSGPVTGEHGWSTYTEDQLALLDHLQVQRFIVAGMCIGGPYSLGLAQAAPDRVAAALVFQTIGLHENRQAFYAMFDSWAQDLAQQSHADVDSKAWQTFRGNLFDGEFLFNVDTSFVAQCSTPMLVLCGDDLYHPRPSSLQLAELAPQAELIEHWKEAPHLLPAQQRIVQFIGQHAT